MRPPFERRITGGVLELEFEDRLEHLRQIQIHFGPGHMLGSEPGAFLALHEPLRNPGLGELRLAEPPSAAKRFEAMRLQGPMGL